MLSSEPSLCSHKNNAILKVPHSIIICCPHGHEYTANSEKGRVRGLQGNLYPSYCMVKYDNKQNTQIFTESDYSKDNHV